MRSLRPEPRRTVRLLEAVLHGGLDDLEGPVLGAEMLDVGLRLSLGEHGFEDADALKGGGRAPGVERGGEEGLGGERAWIRDRWAHDVDVALEVGQIGIEVLLAEALDLEQLGAVESGGEVERAGERRLPDANVTSI